MPRKPTPKAKSATARKVAEPESLRNVFASDPTADAVRRVLAAHFDRTPAEQATLVRLRGEELDRLRERVMRLENSAAARGHSRDTADVELRALVRARDVTTAVLVDRVDGLEERVAAMESALFNIAAVHLGEIVTSTLETIEQAATTAAAEPLQGDSADAASEPAVASPESCTPEFNPDGTQKDPGGQG